MSESLIRKPAVAGQFYPASPDKLRAEVEDYIEGSGVEAAPDRVQCLVVPHAGYVYSGPTAGYGYARVSGDYVQRVVLLGCSHSHEIQQASIVTEGVFDSPLGPLSIDEDLAGGLARHVDANTLEPHLSEHSLEVQLPFICVALGDVPIVPILFGRRFTKWHHAFAETLAQTLTDRDLVVVSTDLSHYRSEEEANQQDQASLDAIRAHDVDALVSGAEAGRYAMCGATAVATSIPFCLKRGVTDWSVLDYRTSAAVSKDYARVVGYAALSMERDL